jgi:RNA polymerase sigma-70 factor (ECF subfamily)
VSLDSTFELLRRARTGDPEALDRLFARHLVPLQRWASGRLPRASRDLAETDDLVQDVLLKTLRTMGDFEPRHVGALQAYLRQAVLNRLRDELRHARRLPDQTDLDDVDLEGGESPLEQAIGRQAVESYERALGRLRPEDREAIIGRVELRLSYPDLAEALGKPTPEAARKAAMRAVYRLVEEMKSDGGR